MVYNAISHWKKYGTEKNVKRQPRPRKTTPRFDKRIVRLSKQDPDRSAVDIRRELLECNDDVPSVQTIRRRLNEAGLFGRIPRKKPLVSAKNRKARVEFAKKYLNWSINEWKLVCFSDETKINRLGSDGRKYIRRPINQDLNPKYTKTVVKHGGGSLMLWGCFSSFGVGPIRKINGIMDQYQYKEILENELLPFSDEHLPLLWKFQHDNDPKHTAKSVKTFLEKKRINVLPWPSNSPDLNPIENLWAHVKNNVGKKNHKNLDELFEDTKKVWSEIPNTLIQKLIESMPRRCAAVGKIKGIPNKILKCAPVFEVSLIKWSTENQYFVIFFQF